MLLATLNTHMLRLLHTHILTPPPPPPPPWQVVVAVLLENFIGASESDRARRQLQAISMRRPTQRARVKEMEFVTVEWRPRPVSPAAETVQRLDCMPRQPAEFSMFVCGLFSAYATGWVALGTQLPCFRRHVQLEEGRRISSRLSDGLCVCRAWSSWIK